MPRSQHLLQRNIARYTVPERRVVRYAMITPEAVKAQAVPTDAEIAKTYQQDSAPLRRDREAHITQVVVADQAGATAIAAKVKGGTSLADAARAAGLEASTQTGVEKAAYAGDDVRAGRRCRLRRRQRCGDRPGPHAARLDRRQGRQDRKGRGAFARSGRGEIAAALGIQESRPRRCRRSTTRSTIRCRRTRRSTKSSPTRSSPAVTTPALIASGVNPDDPASKPDPAITPLVAAAFQAADGDGPQLVQVGTDGGFAVVALGRVVHSAPRPLAQVRAAVLKDVTADRARQAARRVAGEVLARINKGMPIQQSLAQTKLPMPPARTLTAARAQLAADPRGAPPALALMFSMAPNTAKTLAAPDDSGWFVIKLDSIESGNATGNDAAIKAARGNIARSVGREYVEQFAKAVRADVGVKTNPSALARVRADLLGQGGCRATDRMTSAREALAEGRPALVWRRQVADTETPVAAALKLIEPGRGDFLLESVEGGAIRGRHSLIGLAPDLLFRAHGHSAEINRHWATDRETFEPMPGAHARRAARAGRRMPRGRARRTARALACLVGYFGYETIGLVETPAAPAGRSARPARHDLRAADRHPGVRPPDRRALPRRAGLARSGTRCRRDRRPRPKSGSTRSPPSSPARRVPRRSAPTSPSPDLTPALPEGRYGEMVAAAKDYILAGDIFQVVLAQRFSTPFALPPFELYRSLRRINPSPFLYHLDLPGFALIGSSPEILVRVRDDEVTIRPIAGTRPRGKTAAEDEANRVSLLADPKERAEHLMLLDLGRNDVGRVAAPGTVKVTDSYTRRILQPCHAHRLERRRHAVPRQGRARRAVRRLPRRHGQRRAESPRLPDHRRTRTRTPRRLRRRRRLFLARRLDGHLHRAADRGGEGRHDPRPGGRRHRRRQRSPNTNSANAKPRPARSSPPRAKRSAARKRRVSVSRPAR